MTIDTITIDTDEWAVVPRVPTKAMVEAGGYDYCKENSDVFQAMLAAAPRPEPVQQPDPWRPNSIKYDHSIHSNPDAKAWADFFVQTFPGLADKHDLMLGWFANAMMAMHDHLMQQPAPCPVPDDVLSHLRTAWQQHTQSNVDRMDWADICDEIASFREAPLPVTTSERLPTGADADCHGRVWGYNKGGWACIMWFHVHDRDWSYTFWQPTNLKRPPAPGEEG